MIEAASVVAISWFGVRRRLSRCGAGIYPPGGMSKTFLFE